MSGSGSEISGTRPFVFRGCNFTCVWLNGDVFLCAEELGGCVECGPLAAFYFTTVQEGAESKVVCLKLVSELVTLFIVLERWPEGSTELTRVILPYGAGNAACKRGAVGWVEWADGSQQNIKYYERLWTSGDDRVLWIFARFVFELKKSVPRIGGASGGVAQHTEGRFNPPVVPDPAMARKAGTLLGRGYAVGRKFWIAEDFSCVVTLCENGERWYLQPFTRYVLQVLVKKGAGGLTTDDIYRAAKQLFEADHPENGGGAPGLVKPPAYKSLLFFFRRTANGNKSKHPLYDEILIDGCKNATTYTLECRWVESIAANGAAVD